MAPASLGPLVFAEPVPSEIAKPGVAATLLQSRKPVAKWIKRNHYKNPNQINDGQGISPFRRLEEERIFEQPMRLTKARITNHDGKQVYQGDVQKVIEHRHFAYDQRGTQPSRRGAIDRPQ